MMPVSFSHISGVLYLVNNQQSMKEISFFYFPDLISQFRAITINQQLIFIFSLQEIVTTQKQAVASDVI